ncbi:hypothetical protein SH1V18_28210 [Vallitalea longa]|uniref:Uncharacterized protein n=1 Tax=Vallitalea longa TaxID=2936439 RepID=A0A9W5YD02_9FIRM|nr:hypothetical protein [Vallitalea longa]GKX30341.1 hypothetical protein SH1V18_28210 [Vallitalea longa]
MYKINSIIMLILICALFNQIEIDRFPDICGNSDPYQSIDDNSDASNIDNNERQNFFVIENTDEENLAYDSTDMNVIIRQGLDKLADNESYICDDSLLATYKDILTSRVSFHNIDFDKKVFLSEINYEEYSLIPVSYSLIDMNRDSIPELVLEMTLGSADFVMVIHIEDSKISSHIFSHRQMSDIKVDGTFFSSGGAGYYCINELEFVDDNYIINQLGYHEVGWDEEGDVVISYYLGNEKVNETEFTSFMDNFNEKKNAIGCEFPEMD